MTDTKRYGGTSAAKDITGPWMPTETMPQVLRDFHRARDAPMPQHNLQPPAEMRAHAQEQDSAWLEVQRKVAMAHAAAQAYAAEKAQSHEHSHTHTRTR